MKAEIVNKEVKPFEPVQVLVTFEREIDITGDTDGFAYRYDVDDGKKGVNAHSRMTYDNTCLAIREALRSKGY